MKVVVILGIKELQDKLFNALKEQRISMYSKFDIMGHAVTDQENLQKWYDSELDSDYSVAIFTFVKDAETAKNILDEIRMLNESRSVTRPFHAFQMDVEQFA